MHIAIYCRDRLPTKGYGGSQRVAVWLVRGLAELGHQVTLIAGPGSKVPEATLVPVDLKKAYQPGFDVSPLIPPGVEIFHSIAGEMFVPPSVPFLWTQEGNFREGKQPPPHTIYVSHNHASRYGSTSFVYNGIDPAEFEFRPEKLDYDFFIGRLHRVKGYQLAIEGAKRTSRKLLLAGGWRPSLRRQIRFVGEVEGKEKADLLAGARCLWMPALWDEPFGLTLAEALISGTPVIGTHWGSLPEIISPEVGGLGDTIEELVEIARTIDQQRNPDACRARAMEYFTHIKMAEEYVRFYRHFLSTGEVPAGRKTS
ncbi:MAG: glycosyltransferase [Gemmatimonadota bacterium]